LPWISFLHALKIVPPDPESASTFKPAIRWAARVSGLL
jgi:hypothetical protein